MKGLVVLRSMGIVRLFILLFLSLAGVSAQGQTQVYCDIIVAREFHNQSGGAFLVPEKFYKRQNPGDCPNYLGRSCGQFVVPYNKMKEAIGNRVEVPASEVNTLLGTNMKPGTYLLIWVDTDRKELHLRCPRYADLHRAAQTGACPTNDACGCNPLFKDGQAQTSGGVTEGFVSGVRRDQNYWQEKGIVVLK
ncbi:MAG: hypothetical protein JNL72_04075 [Flavipsychrobacter sp.]|nr:hypothetical protein [Flavipsychrobacter sp.]